MNERKRINKQGAGFCLIGIASSNLRYHKGFYLLDVHTDNQGDFVVWYQSIHEFYKGKELVGRYVKVTGKLKSKYDIKLIGNSLEILTINEIDLMNKTCRSIDDLPL